MLRRGGASGSSIGSVAGHVARPPAVPLRCAPSTSSSRSRCYCSRWRCLPSRQPSLATMLLIFAVAFGASLATYRVRARSSACASASSCSRRARSPGYARARSSSDTSSPTSSRASSSTCTLGVATAIIFEAGAVLRRHRHPAARRPPGATWSATGQSAPTHIAVADRFPGRRHRAWRWWASRCWATAYATSLDPTLERRGRLPSLERALTGDGRLRRCFRFCGSRDACSSSTAEGLVACRARCLVRDSEPVRPWVSSANLDSARRHRALDPPPFCRRAVAWSPAPSCSTAWTSSALDSERAHPGTSHRSRLPGCDDLAQPAADRGPPDRRGPRDAPRSRGGAAAFGPGSSSSRSASRSPSAACAVSASAVGRPAPARRHRHRAQRRSGRADRRRADHGPRRHDPGADPGVARSGAGATRDGAAAHHTRSGRRGWHG